MQNSIKYDFLIVFFLAGIKYDAEKEEKYLQDNKQKELSRIEEALQKSAEKGRLFLRNEHAWCAESYFREPSEAEQSWKIPKGKNTLLILQKREGRENLIFHALEISLYWEFYALIFVLYIVFR